MAFLAGKSGSVDVGAATSWKLTDWSMDMDADIVDVTSFQSGGFKENIAGLVSAKLTGSGPYDQGNMPMTAGTAYAFVLKASGSVTWTVTARVSKLQVKMNVKGVAEIHYEAESTGSIVPSIT